jgi:1,4-alpha-glucan branching enzyme
MPGNQWEKFANLRLLLAYLYTHPGKKLLFMGTELAPDTEWDHNQSLDWNLQTDPMRQGFQRFFEDLARLYRQQPALWEWDHLAQGFSWIDCQDYQQGVVSYVRQAKSQHFVCVLNLTPMVRNGYRIGVPGRKAYGERLNTDSAFYGGANIGNGGLVKVDPIPFHSYPQSVSLTLSPLSCLILEPQD